MPPPAASPAPPRARRARRALGTALVAAAATHYTAPAEACVVPVFRYALERWAPSPYRAFLFHHGDLGPAAQAATADLEERVFNGPVPLNLELERIDLDAGGIPAGERPPLPPGEPAAGEAWIQVYRPADARPGPPVWSGRLEAPTAALLADSPLRREIVKRLLSGESAVWVLVSSGDAGRDAQTAEKDLRAHLRRAEEVLEVPEGVVAADAARQAQQGGPGGFEVNLDDVLRSSIPLKIAFSVLTLRRDDPAEAFLLRTLLTSEADLDDFAGEPMAFAVFGRGRALEAFIGAGINEDNIVEACAYLTGACSCQVKAQNPGFDLVTAEDWDARIAGSDQFVAEKELPPLTGAGDLAATDGDGEGAIPSPGPAAPAAPAPTPWPAGRSFSLGFTFTFAGAILLGVLGIATFIIMRGPSS